jgi:hypothetical protein
VVFCSEGVVLEGMCVSGGFLCFESIKGGLCRDVVCDVELNPVGERKGSRMERTLCFSRRPHF